MNTFKLKLRKSTAGKRGAGHITWGRFEAMLRASGLLLEGQHLSAVEVSDDGIVFSTSKAGKR